MKCSDNERQNDLENERERRNGDDPTNGSEDSSELELSKGSEGRNMFDSHDREVVNEKVLRNCAESDHKEVGPKDNVPKKSRLSPNKSDGVGGAAGQ
jgi:hypothetical protein